MAIRKKTREKNAVKREWAANQMKLNWEIMTETRNTGKGSPGVDWDSGEGLK